MQENKFVSNYIDDLIQVNFERMAAFDEASRVINDEDLKNYFDSKAGESERNIEELQVARLNGSQQNNAANGKPFLPATSTFTNAVNRKKLNVIVDAARCVEKHMVEWYQKIEDGLFSIPGELKNLLQQQLSELKTGQSYLHRMTTSLK